VSWHHPSGGEIFGSRPREGVNLPVVPRLPFVVMARTRWPDLAPVNSDCATCRIVAGLQ
jgi:hypothetical protein